ncbi:GGDEF domain-containing protein [Vibrio tarriae]|uniref:diguanylate cyclase n=1 Tax=Vibrio tarriae TaxID=2014742 RepID=A0AAU8WBA3_9VIBR|nr:GGDEF domain-containing protein [Vibrio tarriae]QEO47142.1 GGDEF domain-containing protein [Vibrio cholerae]ASK53689.1 GGDEF domain-containing protein [Vibrio tarriae]RBM26198.1 GGDEF domain-containing protein [Vibrio tarriae]RBM31660.1 GGDEF domain-containing protein [Vibrio tarriae]RBM33735.1 GGDEF domain-containing protein [Vibrio tarriae]
MNTQTQKTLHPLILHAKTLLIFMSAFLILANLYLINNTRDLSKSYSSHTNQAIWFLFQLNKEFTELLALSPYLLESENNQRSVMVKYELAWSRFDLILNSKEADGIIGMPSTREFFQAAFARFKQLEPLLLAAKNPESLQSFILAAQQEMDIFIQFINRTFGVQSPLYVEQKEQLNYLSRIQFALMLLMFSCVGLVSFILHKEAAYHRILALTDPLTGLENRTAMFAELERHRRSGGFSLFLLDLNGFKMINDTYGHQMGDAVLKQVAYRLNHSIPAFDYRVFRMGGDEFAIILSSINPTEQMMMQRMIKQSFDQEFELTGDLRAKLNTSIGVSTYPLDTTNLNQLIYLADKNMYEMKFLQKSPSS